MISEGWGLHPFRSNITNFIYNLTFFKKKLKVNGASHDSAYSNNLSFTSCPFLWVKLFYFPKTYPNYFWFFINRKHGYLLSDFGFHGSMLTVFLFKNRKLQLRFNKLNLLIHSIFLAGLIYLMSQDQLEGETFKWFVLPIISIISILMASRSINKDEELIRSVDRLRWVFHAPRVL